MTIEQNQAKEAGAGQPTVIFKSVCRSCHGGCGTLLHVREGVLIKVEGDPQSPLNHGRLCPIGTVTVDLVNHPDRLQYPRRRVGPRGSGQWTRISWDEALDEIAERLLAIREGIWARSHRNGHRHRPPSYPLGVAVWSCARHAELVRAGLCAMLSSTSQHLHSYLWRLSGLRFHRRNSARLYAVLGPQSA